MAQAQVGKDSALDRIRFVNPHGDPASRNVVRQRGILLLVVVLGDSNNTVRGYCLDIPRFEESLNN